MEKILSYILPLLSTISNVPYVLYSCFVPGILRSHWNRQWTEAVPQEALTFLIWFMAGPDLTLKQRFYWFFYQCYNNLHTQRFVQVSPVQGLCMVYSRPLRRITVWGGLFTWMWLVSPFSFGEKKEKEINKEKMYLWKRICLSSRNSLTDITTVFLWCK